MSIKRVYDRSFKERAVELSYERSSVKELAKELGVSVDRIYSWRSEIKSYGSASFQGHGVERLNDHQRRVKELEKQLRTRELELEILKKAIAIFSKLEK